MQRRFFSQCFCLLTDGSTSIASIAKHVRASGLSIERQMPASENWQHAGETIVVPFQSGVGGGVSIDVVEYPWPDHMGDPKSDTMTMSAWSMGFFGPFAFPGGLQRAVVHAWGRPAGRSIVPAHRGVVRLRTSSIPEASSNPAAKPRNGDALLELQFLTHLVSAVGSAPGVMCYFNPNGEVLQDLARFKSISDACQRQEKIPLQLWANVRLFKLTADFGIMDTVGNEQFDVMDIETIYPTGKYDPATIDYYMRNVTHYLLDMDRELQTGEAIDGPDERELSWVIESRESAVTHPPRRALRLSPAADAEAIRAALEAASRR